MHKKDDRLSIVPDHPLLKDAIPCRADRSVSHDFKEGDWAVAEMRRHPLKGDRGFYAELTQFITFSDDVQYFTFFTENETVIRAIFKDQRVVMTPLSSAQANTV